MLAFHCSNSVEITSYEQVQCDQNCLARVVTRSPRFYGVTPLGAVPQLGYVTPTGGGAVMRCVTDHSQHNVKQRYEGGGGL